MKYCCITVFTIIIALTTQSWKKDRMARILITSALPYINGVKHLGNLVGSQLPADTFARFMRLKNHEVLFICATDEHGTPAELAAKEANTEINEFCSSMWESQKTLVMASVYLLIILDVLNVLNVLERFGLFS